MASLVPPGKRPRLFAWGFLVVAAMAGVLLAVHDLDGARRILEQADARALPGALLCTLGAYVTVSYSFAVVCRTLGLRMRRRDLAGIGFVTVVLNHVLTTGGVVGYSVRYALMRRHGIRLKDVISSSILHFYLTSLPMLAMLPVALLYLLGHARVSAGLALWLALMAALGAVVFVTATALIFLSGIRGKVLRGLARVARRVLRRDINTALLSFDESLRFGAKTLWAHPTSLVLVIGLNIADFLLSLYTLGFCFRAFGADVAWGVLMSGFVIGVLAGVASMIPGGLGVQEGSMTGLFVLLGIPVGQAVLAVLSFRAVFYFAPYFASFVFFGRLMRPVAMQGPDEFQE